MRLAINYELDEVISTASMASLAVSAAMSKEGQQAMKKQLKALEVAKNV